MSGDKIWIKDIDDYQLNKDRMKITSELLEDRVDNQYTISIDGESKVERILKLIHFTDWVSYYSALLLNVDPTPVNRIIELKQAMNIK